jgi:flagellar hook assembly protein FlgD
MTPTPSSTHTPTNTITPTRTITQTHTPQPTPGTDRALDKNVVDVSKGETLKIMVRTTAAGVIVKLKAYNLSGEMVRKGEFTAALAGWNEVTWDMKNDANKTLGQGIYFIHIDAEGRKAVKKVYIIK